jgi:2-hydroxy-3-oxopropionate reductase
VTAIGFVGLGKMGIPMAENLLKAGHSLALSRIRDGSRHLLGFGGTEAHSGADAVKDAEVVILMLPDTPDVEKVLFGEDGVAANLRPGSLVIDMSSISPVATRRFGAKVEASSGSYLDAPVSGGEVGARNATLSIMVGGSEEAFARALPLLQTMGKNINLVGPCGNGQMAKVANQMIVALTIEAVGEAFLLAKKAGADLGRLRSALMGGFAGSRILELHGQRMIDEAFDPGFRIRVHRKDLGLALDAARSLEVALPNTSATMQLMNAAMALGDGDLDHSALFRSLSHLSSASHLSTAGE